MYKCEYTYLYIILDIRLSLPSTWIPSTHRSTKAFPIDGSKMGSWGWYSVPVKHEQEETWDFHGYVKIHNIVFFFMTPCTNVAGWRWRQYGPQKHWYPTTFLHSIITQITAWMNKRTLNALRGQSSEIITRVRCALYSKSVHCRKHT